MLARHLVSRLNSNCSVSLNFLEQKVALGKERTCLSARSQTCRRACEGPWTPASHDATEEEPEPLYPVQHSKYRSQVARCLLISQDRADITFIVNELCQRMSNPTQQSLAKLKRLVRYLKRERQWDHIFRHGRLVEEVTTFADSDWAGCKETRKSSSAGVIMLGDHALKAYTRKQNIIERSSAEAEVHTAAVGASESKGIASLLKDLGYEMKPVSAVDAKAIEHILHRQGIGKLTHIDVATQQSSDCEALPRAWPGKNV